MIIAYFVYLQISSIKKLVPRLNAMLFKMGFAENMNDIKPVSTIDNN
jgi:hypothetical protein